MEKQLNQFIKKESLKNRKVLLGFSGGPDSLALFLLLLKMDVQMSVAYVDHGWRKESEDERKDLENLAKRKGVPFYSTKISYPQKVKNLESFCRKARLDFFKNLVEKEGFAGVFLGHHGDDIGENVLKRVLEGYKLPFLGGMKPVANLNGIKIFRPFLFTEKKEILRWLKENPSDFQPFNDKTNRDTRFLRGKMREEMLPYLESRLGKKIKRNLLRVGEDAYALLEYLDRRVLPAFEYIRRNSWGFYLPFSQIELDLYEKTYLLKKFFTKRGFDLSYTQFESFMECLVKSSGNKKFLKNGKVFYADRGNLFVFEKEISGFKEKWPIKEGVYETDSLKAIISKAVPPIKKEAGWKSLWEEGIFALLSKEALFLSGAKPSMSFKGGKSLDKYWSDSKVPAFLRDKVPAVFSASGCELEFLAPDTVGCIDGLFQLQLLPK